MLKDAGHFDVEPVLPAIDEEQGLGAPLSLVVTAAGADGIDIPPVLFSLRVNVRVSGAGGAVPTERNGEPRISVTRDNERVQPNPVTCLLCSRCAPERRDKRALGPFAMAVNSATARCPR